MVRVTQSKTNTTYLVGSATVFPASTDDCSEVGGSSVGWTTSSRSAAAKSRAAVPGNPSLTPVVLLLSWAACSVEGGTASEPEPVPWETDSASLLRAERDLTLSLSMAATRLGLRTKGWDRERGRRKR
jgi:hypothetical protein